ncbi:MAG: PEP-CTERM sorting domain-containing protein, partial [Rubritepida sp.]|nr:PEP-CTERM sorting domain-containing protein [Rubritepida sp.]
ALAPMSVRAAALYNFTFTQTPGIGFPGGGVGDISGTFTVDAGVSPNRIIGITGVTVLGAITGLVPPSGTPGAPDNLFFPAGPFLSTRGVAFTDGFGQVTLAFDSGSGAYVAFRDSPAASSSGTLTVTAVPAPAALALFGLGLVGLALAQRRR